ncbi:FAD-dependent monooxygenase [Reichenbachiella versicolor]|uniref:FAD-dependent monooxygenase n=1 Tax=Reichenbachiella versicolor TaxID=1821036 RepID=UPI000D6E2C75|nr:FAD-dependent monooxygenase [Reichenbachiella versicolor]
MEIDIIGAGIGGLTTAIALEQKGITTRIFEQADELAPVGAGIILANNAMQIYEKLGLRTAIEEKGNPISSMNITSMDLKSLSKVDLSYFEQKYGVKNIAIHRGALQNILLEELNSTGLNLGHALDQIVELDNKWELIFKNGTQTTSSVLIGADGIHSAVRKSIFSKYKIRKANQICWRGVAEIHLPSNYHHELNEAWGKGDRFGFVQIADNKVYWYALKSFKSQMSEFDISEITSYFSQYHPMIKDILAATVPENIYTAEITDLKPTKGWHKNNVCLIGDAAHATTPNMGQGACQAIEDAFILAECLNKYPLDQAFSKFEKLRIAKAHQVVKTSWAIGKMAHISNPFLSKLRNQLMKSMPESMNRKQTEKIFKLETL